MTVSCASDVIQSYICPGTLSCICLQSLHQGKVHCRCQGLSVHQGNPHLAPVPYGVQRCRHNVVKTNAPPDAVQVADARHGSPATPHSAHAKGIHLCACAITLNAHLGQWIPRFKEEISAKHSYSKLAL